MCAKAGISFLQHPPPSFSPSSLCLHLPLPFPQPNTKSVNHKLFSLTHLVTITNCFLKAETLLGKGSAAVWDQSDHVCVVAQGGDRLGGVRGKIRGWDFGQRGRGGEGGVGWRWGEVAGGLCG